MKKEPKVEIALSTYNGKKYLKEQLDSILNQTYSNILITIRDDCSTDITMDILLDYCNSYPGKIRIIENNNIRLGVVGSFSRLLEAVESDYIFLADQDDYWVKEKIQKQMELIIKMEIEFGENRPFLVHSDLHLVNEKLESIYPSVLKYIGRNYKKRNLNNLLVSNFVAGCSILMNRQLLEIATPFPAQIHAHDWWLTILASAVGKIGFIEYPLIDYRQHDLNEVGAKQGASILRPFSLFRKLFVFLLNDQRLDNVINQAKALKSSAESLLTYDQLYMIDAFINLKNQNYIEKRKTILKYRFFKHKPIQIFSQLFQIV
jgi:glycosyltransferase involved in cell wall biosynthesis